MMVFLSCRPDRDAGDGPVLFFFKKKTAAYEMDTCTHIHEGGLGLRAGYGQKKEKTTAARIHSIFIINDDLPVSSCMSPGTVPSGN